MEISWIVVKGVVKRVYSFFKTYWYIPAVLIYTVVLYVIFRRKEHNIQSVLEMARNRHREEIEILKRYEAEEIEKRREIIRNYDSVIESIYLKYEDDKEELKIEEKEEIKRIAREFYEEPDRMREILEEKYGLVFVENEVDDQND